MVEPLLLACENNIVTNKEQKELYVCISSMFTPVQ